MRITGVTSTDLFTGTARRPLQIIQVSLATGTAGTGRPVRVRVDGAGVSTPAPAQVTAGPPGETVTAEVPVEIAAPFQPGVPRPVTAIAETGGGGAPQRAEFAARVTPAEPGWTMWMVSHFHYDPVWWGTQGQFTESRLLLPDDGGALPEVRTAFELVRLHLDKARSDPDYKFVLAELDYLKPHFDAYPEDRADVRRFLSEGRIELVGGTYNEPNTNLTGAESTIRNAVYGMGFQRDVLGADPRSAWMLDAFGHDPGFPGLMAAAGLTSSAWARGPFHQWGPSGTEGGNPRMQFASEFEWMSPDGTGLLTAYMANHYGAGWAIHRLPDLAAAEAEALNQFRSLAAVAATRNVLLPVGADHVIPPRWVTEIHRDWNARYVWPRFVTAVPADFFAAVRDDAQGRGTWITPQTRDMNPLYTGKDVSYIDTKQAQRAAEVACLDGERLATVAWLAGAPYPAESVDKAWRQLAYGAHHDAITGTEGDQVYLDLLAGWREAWERGSTARAAAVRHLAGASSAAPSPLSPAGREGSGGEIALPVFNTLSRPRSGMARSALTFPGPGTGQVTLYGPSGEQVPFLAEGVRRHPDGSLAELTVTFRAAGVPAVGYRAYRAIPEAAAGAAVAENTWRDRPGTVIENERFRITADPARGGTLASIADKRTGVGLLRGPGNEAVLADEYPAHPHWGEGPWHLSPTGTSTGSAAGPARVRSQRCPVGSRLVAEFDLDGLAVVQETVLWDGEHRVEFRTHVDGSIGQDRMLRVRFPADVPGGLPVYETATAVIGRPFAHPDVDTAEHWWTLDNPAHDWFGVGSTARVTLTGPDGTGPSHAIGVAEVITPAGAAQLADEVRGLVAALAAAGVTATCSRPDGPRYGGIDADSNVPDVRIALGGPDANSFTAAALAAAGQGYAGELAARAGAGGPARLWLPAARPRAQTHQPSADLRGPSDLPVLIVAGTGPDGLAAAITELAGDLSDAVVEVPAASLAGRGAPADPPLARWSVALLNRGTPSGAVSPDGTLTLTLMRACSSWPAGVWIDGDRRAAPDGSSFAWQHWSHTFEYALISGAGDWREARFGPAGTAYNHELISCAGGGAAAVLAPGVSLIEVDHPAVQRSTLKPRGNPLARGLPGLPAAADGLTMRLRETEGRPARARVRLRGGIAAAHLTDLLEAQDGPALAIEDEDVLVDLPPFGTVTAVMWPVVPPAAGLQGEPPVPHGTTNLLAQTSVPDGTLAGLLEPAQPVYSRYWLHGKGPAPAGNLPVAVHISPRLSGLALDCETGPPGGNSPGAPPEAHLRVTVACGTEPASGSLRLLVPDELEAEFGGPGTGSGPPRAGASAYDLPARGYADWDVRVRARPGAPRGRYVVAAQISDDLGQVIEDTAFVQAGGPGEPDLFQPLAQVLPAVEASTAAIAGEIGLTVLTPALRLAPGAEAEVGAEVINQLASPLRAEAQLISPFGSWEALGPWTQGLRAAPGERLPVRFGGRVPATARPGTRWWAIVKIMYFGRVRYSAAIPVTVTGSQEEPR
ncbi:MAG TPA: glycoside hydrolase family 38 C-terminal domain-containing protein [Streptosporangiaceae bacterium]